MKRDARRYLIYMQYIPEQIAGRCRQQGKEMVSYETLYKWIWYEKGHGNKELAECLRGANENINGLIRQYIPKGTDFSTLTDEYIAEVEWTLNNRKHPVRQTAQLHYQHLLRVQKQSLFFGNKPDYSY